MNTCYLKVEHGTLAYDDTGAGPTHGPTPGPTPGPLVLCVPSLGDLRGEYRLLIPLLAAAGCRVVTLDVRGHGATSTGWPDYSVAAIGADMLALVRSLNAGPAFLVGESMAAGAAVWAAAEAPELVQGLVLIGPFMRGESTWAGRTFYRALFARPWGPALWQRYYTMLYPTRKPDDFAAYTAALRTNLAQPGRMEALHHMLAAPKTASEQRLAQVKAPALVLMGSKDPDFRKPESEAAWVAQKLHGAYHMVEGAGHYPQAEMPELAAGLIREFLNQTSRPTGQPTGPSQHVAQPQEPAYAA